MNWAMYEIKLRSALAEVGYPNPSVEMLEGHVEPLGLA